MNMKKGVVLITVLWILLILALLAMGLSWLGSGEMSLMKISTGKLRSYVEARGGVTYAENYLLKRPSDGDVLGRIGTVPKPGEDDIPFVDVPLGDGERFDVVISDEMGRLNINQINLPGGIMANVFRSLVDMFEPELAVKIVDGVLAYKVSSQAGGATRIFFFPEELMLIDGMTSKLYKQLKPFITVYPQQSLVECKVNLYTAPEQVVKAVFQGIVRQKSVNVSPIRDAENFLSCRDEAVLNKTNPVVKCGLPSYLTGNDFGPFHSGLYRIRSSGRDEGSRVRSVVESVVQVVNGASKTISWHRE